VVTKGGVEGRADKALVAQLGGSHKPLALAGAAAAVMATMPGLPALPFLALGALAGGGAWYRFNHPPVTGEPETIVSTPANAEAPIADAMRIDMIRVELGYGLLPLAGGDQPKLTDQIRALRRSIATEMGFVLPPVRIQDNLQLEAEQYVIKIKEIEAGRGELRAMMLLAMDPAGGTPTLPGERTTEPAFGLPAIWIDPAQREAALTRNCTVVDPPSVLATHLTELVRDMMPELLSYAEAQKLLDELPREQQKLVSDLVPSVISVGGVQRVLQALLAERVSIRDLPTILEGIHEACAGQPRGIAAIVAIVRVRLARQLCESHAGAGGLVKLVALSPEWENAFAESLVGPVDDRQLAMAPTRLAEFMRRFREVFDEAAASAPILLTSPGIRAPVRAIVERIRPSTAVLAQSEIHTRARIRTVATI
jgi:flagellar biosynthesis protein FlhA